MEIETFILEYSSLIGQDANSAKFQLHDSIGRIAVYNGNLLNRSITIGEKVSVEIIFIAFIVLNNLLIFRLLFVQNSMEIQFL